MKDLLLITGSYPPDVCGVGDATAKVINTTIGQTWELYYRKTWSITTLLSHIRAINATKAKYLLMEFSTRGYGWSLVPHLLCVYFSWFTSKRFGVVMHEQSQMSLKAYLAELLILISANRIIFTNQFERQYAIKRIPRMAGRSTVVKIFSNISAATTIRSMAERSIDVVNFGQIMPNKGLEQFIQDVAPLTSQYKIVIAGQVVPMFAEYYKKIERLCREVGVEIKTNLSDADVVDLLNNTKVVYLPFPDGVSERRGSLFAAMVNGAAVATTFGRFTTPALAAATIDISKKSLADILADSQLLTDKQQAAQMFMRTQMPQGWEEVARGYDEFIKQ